MKGFIEHILTPVKTNPSGVILTILAGLFGHIVSMAQNCLPGTYPIPQDTTVYIDLGSCSVDQLGIKNFLGIGNCNNLVLTPPGPYYLNDSLLLDLRDINTNSSVKLFKLKIKPKAFSSYTGISNNILYRPMLLGECSAYKNVLLDQLNVVDDAAIRSQIHFVKGNSRITQFTIGDTITIDKVECNGRAYWNNIKVLFRPTNPTKTGSLPISIGLTTCKLTIEQVLAYIGYSAASCDHSKLFISNAGPFGYGTHQIQSVMLDNYPLMSNVSLYVHPGDKCPVVPMDFGKLEAGQCYLNESDILGRLGITFNTCDYSKIKLYPPGPYESSPQTIQRIEIDGVTVCPAPFDVTFTRDSFFQENLALFCNSDLNIALEQNCKVTLYADNILEGGNYCYKNYWMSAAFSSDPLKPVAQGNKITLSSPGMYLITVTNPLTGNSCWSKVTIEDKYIEDIRCTPDTVLCYDDNGLFPDKVPGKGPDFPFIGQNVTYNQTAAAHSYDIIGTPPCGIKKMWYNDTKIAECQNGWKKIIDRLWTFEDAAGNRDTCLQRIYVRNSELEMLDNFKPFYADCFSDFVKLDNKGYPHPDVTGYPTIDSLFPADICGSLKMNYSDSNFPLCGKSVKIVRQWTVIDWCSDRVRTLDQIIRVEDKKAPEILIPAKDTIVNADPFICGVRNLKLKPPVYQDCGSSIVNIELLYETFDFLGNKVWKSNGTNLTIPEILMQSAMGEFKAVFVLSDECSNQSRDTIQIKIIDKEAPIAICNEYTIVTIGGSGESIMRALSLDNLSVDNCGIKTYEARKMNGDCYVDNKYAEYVRFCCAEIGDTILVQFRVTDFAGNTNNCMVRVFLQDKFPPKIECPRDITLDCGQDYKDLNLTGKATALDNCSIDTLYYVDQLNLDACGLGMITRTWIARDIGGFEISCVQKIIIQNFKPFTMPADKWPKDAVVNGCGALLSPELLGAPDIRHSGCANTSHSYVDIYFYNVEDACFKILREWTVIDWCQFSQSSSTAGIWKDIQVIKNVSTEGPVFTHNLNNKTYCITADDCTQMVQFAASAKDKDNCTKPENLMWSYSLRNQSGQEIRSGSGPEIKEKLGYGKYKVIFRVTDECKNTALDTVYFETIDCRPPDIQCPVYSNTLILNEEGKASLKISDLLIGAKDNCHPAEPMTFSFSSSTLKTELSFDCGHLLGFTKNTLRAQVYVSDPSGNMDSCEIQIVLEDNSRRACAVPDTLRVGGAVLTDDGAQMQDVKVLLTRQGQGVAAALTSNAGNYSFGGISYGDDFTLSYSRDGIAIDGLSTVDIYLMQRHILGISILDSPYKIIASDANNDNKVSASDLVQFRKIILGAAESFPNDQKVWRFVDAKYVFSNPKDPFPFPESLSIQGMSKSEMSANFKGIKIGDVNGSNSISSAYKAGKRNRDHMQLVVDAMPLSTNSEQCIPVYLRQATKMVSFQAAFSYDPLLIEFKEIKARQLPLMDFNYSIDKERGHIRISWNAADIEGIYLEENTELFQFIVDSFSDEPLSELVSLDSKLLKAELANSNLSIHNLDLSFEEGFRKESNQGYSLVNVSNRPNPFTDETRLELVLNRDEYIKLELFDMKGQLIYTDHKKLSRGVNVWLLTSEILPASSQILIARLSTQSEVKFHRMTLIR